MSTKPIRWGLLAAGTIATTFARDLLKTDSGILTAIASRNGATAARLRSQLAPDNQGIQVYNNYDALLAADDVDAVYISTPHTSHTMWALRALEAGKHVLCEKPLGLNHAEALAVVTSARHNNRFLMEAFMYRCHPQTLKLKALIAEGAIGALRHIEARFGYHAPLNAESRLFNAQLAGGGILDVGCYPVSMARLLVGDEPTSCHANGHIGSTGVDEWSAALLTFEHGVSAQIATAVSLSMENGVHLYGNEGEIHVATPWLPGAQNGSWQFTLHRGDHSEQISGTSPGLYTLEADEVARCIQAGLLESPRMSWQDTLGNAHVLDLWRNAIGLQYPAERTEAHNGPLNGRALTRANTRSIACLTLPHISKPVSRLVMGCDNQPNITHAALMWDQYFQSGGNTFDTAYIYGGGRMERYLGQWHTTRGVREELVIIGKGAHTPDNFPERIAAQLTESLERLQTDYVDLYFLHRDNPDIPVGEFVDALNQEVRAGRIRAFGGSNWTLNRVKAANDWARSQSLQAFTALSNNFSLAQMINPIWPGVEAASSAEFVDFLRSEQIALFPWSSQARGFFTPFADQVIQGNDRAASSITAVQPTAAEMRHTWMSADNIERRRRAGLLAQRHNVEMIQIALAYVVAQAFPCLPLVGPRVPLELESCIAAAALNLTEAECAWLDLRSETVD